MTQNPDFSDETLTAYLDGELSAEDLGRVERELSRQGALAQRLSELDISIESIRAGADAVLATAPAPPEILPTGSKAVWPWAAGLVAACAVGFVIGSAWKSSETQDWVAAVANYQSLYVADTLARSERPDQRAASLTTLSAAIGLDLSPLLNITAIEYRRAQMLGFEGKPLVQLAYLDGDVPIAICITPRNGDNRPLQEGEYFGLATAYWQKDGRGFLVIGGKDSALIRQIAEQVDNAI